MRDLYYEIKGGLRITFCKRYGHRVVLETVAVSQWLQVCGIIYTIQTKMLIEVGLDNYEEAQMNVRYSYR